MKTNTVRFDLRARLVAALLLGFAASAAAHHGNPDAPVSGSWSSGPSSSGPAKPLGPGY
jgi:hypothetical protein